APLPVASAKRPAVLSLEASPVSTSLRHPALIVKERARDRPLAPRARRPTRPPLREGPLHHTLRNGRGDVSVAGAPRAATRCEGAHGEWATARSITGRRLVGEALAGALP